MKSKNIKFNLQTPHLFPLDITFKEIDQAGGERKALVIHMGSVEILILKSVAHELTELNWDDNPKVPIVKPVIGKLFISHHRMMDSKRNSNPDKVIGLSSLSREDVSEQIIYFQLLGEIMDHAKELDWD